MRPLAYYIEQHYPFTVTRDPDGGYFIAFPDLPGCMTQVDHPDEIGQAAEEIRLLWLETAHERAMPIPLPQASAEYSGKFVIRVPRALHRDLADSALREGVSLNQYIATLLARNDALARVERRIDESDRQGTVVASSGHPNNDRASSRRRGTLSAVAGEQSL